MKHDSLTDEQHEFYKSQPTEYRRGWWSWALTQPNFLDMYRKFVEADEGVIRARESAFRNIKVNGHD